MADVAASLYDWSTTASSNSPSDATTVGAGLADNIQQVQATVRGWLAHKGSDLSSAQNMTPGATVGLFHDITGTTAIESFGTVSAGIFKIFKFEGALTLTHNATSLILPGGANITTANGDMAMFTSEGSGNWRCNWYTKAAAAADNLYGLADPAADRILFWDDSEGKNAHLALSGLTITTTTLAVDAASDTAAGKVELATTAEVQTGTDTARAVTPAGMQNGKIVLGTEQATTSGTAINFTSIPAWAKRIVMSGVGVSTNGTSNLIAQIGDSGGLENTNYQGATWTHTGGTTTAWSSGFIISNSVAAAGTNDFKLVVELEDSTDFTWAANVVNASSAPNGNIGVGNKALSAALDRITLTTANGTDAFDAGVVNIQYT